MFKKITLVVLLASLAFIELAPSPKPQPAVAPVAQKAVKAPYPVACLYCPMCCAGVPRRW